MPYIQIDNLNMFYEEFGYGEPVIFLHSAYSRGILAFSGQILPFSGAGYHCYYPDFRGHGRSVCEDLTWDSGRLADDIVKFMDCMGIKQAHLIGYSTGGGVAYYIAAKHPERVKSLISIGNGGVIDTENSEDYEPENLVKNGETDFIETMKHRHAQAHGGNVEEYLRQEVKDWHMHPRLSKEEWEKITMPMMLIAGERDAAASRERLEEIKEICTQAEVHIIKDSGHGPHFPTEKCKEVNELMLRFLADTSTIV